MPSYQWKGRRWNSDALSEGQIQADSLAGATSELLRQSFEILAINLATEEGLEGAQKLLEIRQPEKIRPDVFRAQDEQRPSTPKKSRVQEWLRKLLQGRGWSPTERAVFFRQLSMLLGAGVRLHHAFYVLSESQPDPSIARRLLLVPEDPCFDEGLRKTQLLNPFEIAQVEAALENGTLAETFLRLADQVEQWNRCRRALWLQLSTPVTALVLCWILFPILGRLVGVLLGSLAELGQKNQLAAVVLQSNTWLVLAWAMPVVMLWLGKSALEKFLASAAGRRRLLSAPLLGRLCTDFDLSISLKIFSDLFEGGIRLERALELTQKNSLLDCWGRMKVAVENGRELSSALDQPGEAVLRQTIKAGEESAKLGLLCHKMHLFFEEQANTTLRGLMSLVEPCVTILVSLVVGATCWLCLSPILKIAQSL